MAGRRKQDGAQAAAPGGGSAPEEQASAVRVTARREGFRRAGRAWSRTPTELGATALSAEELARLRAEPMLVVETMPPAAAAGQAGHRAEQDGAQAAAPGGGSAPQDGARAAAPGGGSAPEEQA